LDYYKSDREVGRPMGWPMGKPHEKRLFIMGWRAVPVGTDSH